MTAKELEMKTGGNGTVNREGRQVKLVEKAVEVPSVEEARVDKEFVEGDSLVKRLNDWELSNDKNRHDMSIQSDAELLADAETIDSEDFAVDVDRLLYGNQGDQY